MTGPNDFVQLIDDRIDEWMRVRGPRGLTPATVDAAGDVKPDGTDTGIPAGDVARAAAIGLTAGDRLVLGWTHQTDGRRRRRPVVLANLTAADPFAGLTSGRVVLAGTGGTLVDDADLTFAVDTLTAAKVATGQITDSGLTSGRVVLAGAAGLLGDDADLTFATDTLTATKIVGTTSVTSAAVTDSGLTSGRVVLAGTGGLLGDDADLTFSGTRLTATDLTVTNAPIVSSLTAGRVVFAGASKELVDDADLTFATATLTATNIAATTVKISAAGLAQTNAGTQMEATSTETTDLVRGITAINRGAGVAGGKLAVGHSRNAAVGAFTAVTTGDSLGDLDFYGDDGTDFDIIANRGAVVRALVTEAWGNTAHGAKLRFFSTPDGSTTLTQGLTVGPGSKLGFFATESVAKGAAFTQTYATAAHTLTQAAMTDPAAYGAGANGYSTGAMASAIHAEVIALRANMVVTQNVLNGLIDDLQALGLV